MYPLYGIYILIAIATSIFYMDTALFFQKIETDRTKYELDYSVNAASDAAVLELQDTSQITPTGNVYVDPEFIWYVYRYTFLRSTNLWSEANMDAVESNFPSVVITVNDGYYMRLLVDENAENGQQKKYRFTQKIPFARTTLVDTVTTGDENRLTPNLIPAGTVVADTMDGSNIAVFREGASSTGGEGDSFIREYEVYQTDGATLKTSLGSAHDLVDINKMILQALDYTMFNNSAQSNKVDKGRLSIPDQVSSQLLSPSVSFVGSTIFAFSDNFNLKGKSYFNYYSVGASQVVKAMNYYCYTRGGKRYYSRIDPASPQGINGGQADGGVDQIYRTAREAAEANYHPDPLFY